MKIEIECKDFGEEIVEVHSTITDYSYNEALYVLHALQRIKNQIIEKLYEEDHGDE